MRCSTGCMRRWRAAAMTPIRDALDHLADLIRRQQLALVVLVTTLPATTTVARLALLPRRPRRIRRRWLRGVRRILRQPRFEIGDPRHQARNRLIEELLLLGNLPLQLGDAEVSGIGRANLPIGIFRLALSTTFPRQDGERLPAAQLPAMQSDLRAVPSV